MHRDIFTPVRKHAVAAFVFGLGTTACNDELTEPLVEPVPVMANSAATAAGDRSVLVALYEATNGPDWDDSDNWLTDAPLSAWHGVETDATGRVRVLDLADNNLSGEIPSELGSLSNLEWLMLSVNDLSGEIPSELGSLSNLERLMLSSNDLSGEIPSELGSLSNLERLYLYDNELSGEIPSELGSLSNLRTLYLGLNDLSGEIPSELGSLVNLRWLHLLANDLSGEIPSELGSLVNLRWLYLYDNELSGEIPSELGSLSNLERLYLYDNELSGEIPSELGSLSNLERLYLPDNELSGVVPPELDKLVALQHLFVAENDGLCAPGTPRFVSFVARLEYYSGPFCHEAEAEVLRSFYHLTGGSDWASSGGWLQPGPLTDWYGVETDSISGRVVSIDLSDNGLSGALPANWTPLGALRELRIDGNGRLDGRLALGLTALPLRILSYADTNLCIPDDPAFLAWLRSIPSHSGTGVECLPLTDRDVLEILFTSTGGSLWTNRNNWLTNAPLSSWHGIQTNASGGVISLKLGNNGLSGEIPAELGSLANLQQLHLSYNNLSGEIPSELGSLSNLERLMLSSNELSGEIPSELGSLANLQQLHLSYNNLSGEIPSELGSLSNLRTLYLGLNDLSGEIPSELGSLSNLWDLNLFYNDLSGEIPSELGSLVNLRWLHLLANDLSGEIPSELGSLVNLRWLYLYDNELSGEIPSELGSLSNLERLMLSSNDLSGEIPSELGSLSNLEKLYLAENANLFGTLPIGALDRLTDLRVGGTSLCVQDDDFAVRLRLRSFWNQYIRRCKTQKKTATTAATTYVVQAVQSRDFPVPLVAGRPGLLRVLVAASNAEGVHIPTGVATFYQQDGSKHSIRISPGSGTIPERTETAERSLARSAYAAVPGDVLRPGVEVVVVLDAEGALDPALGVPRRIPAMGRATLDVYEMPTFDVTVVPFLWESSPDSSILDATSGLTADAPLFEETRNWLPVGPMSVTVHEPVWTSSNSGFDVSSETRAIRSMEGGTGYYMGTMRVFSDVGGVASSPGKVMASSLNGETVAHEFGHNMHLGHAPCGGAGGPDPGYPHANGRSGAWGWDHRSRQLVPPKARDVMGYCISGGISDYHFSNALRWRLLDETGIGAGPTTDALLLWGGVGTDGRPFLNPAFVVEAPPTRLDGTGAWQVAGEAEDGRVLFTRRFEMAETADAEGQASFALVLAAEAGWVATLSRIVLTGPDGTVAMDAESGSATALLRDPATGRVRGILRDWPGSAAAAGPGGAGGLPEQGLEVQVSRGVPRPDAWR